jgi:hypothetical protein
MIIFRDYFFSIGATMIVHSGARSPLVEIWGARSYHAERDLTKGKVAMLGLELLDAGLLLGDDLAELVLQALSFQVWSGVERGDCGR